MVWRGLSEDHGAKGHPEQAIAFAENSFLREGEWALPESLQGAGSLIAIGARHDPQKSLINPIE